MKKESIKCLDCEFFKIREGNPNDYYYRPQGVCALPSAPKYVIDGENNEAPRWCPRKERY